MRTVAVVTAARSDFGIYRPVLRRIAIEQDLKLRLIVTGMHLSPEFGMTVNEIEREGFEVDEKVDMLLSGDSPTSIAKSMGIALIGMAQVYERVRPDVLLVLGDRFEMHAAAVASVPFRICLAHIHGGETTEGAIDDAFRHSITKLSHLHFASTEFHGRRIVQMGEDPWRVTVSGAPGLDNLLSFQAMARRALEAKLQFALDRPCVLVTFHPVTREYEQTEEHMKELLLAVERSGCRAVFTYPNADTNGRLIIRMIHEFAKSSDRVKVVENLGTDTYFSLMKHVDAMVGNSSSGIVEAASFKLPVVNVGNRQRGRQRARNVIDVGNRSDQILAGIRQALTERFRAELQDLVNPYGDGRASERIVERLRTVSINDDLFLKGFYQERT